LVFLAVVIPFIIVLFRFRKKKGDAEFIPEQVEGNQKLETIWTIIPIILVVIMAVPTVLATFELADDADAAEHIILMLQVTNIGGILIIKMKKLQRVKICIFLQTQKSMLI